MLSTAKTLHNRDTTLLEALEGNGDDSRERTVTRRGGLLERPAMREQINAFDCRCGHEHPCRSLDEVRNLHVEKQYT